jgi:hypothetical protein
MIQRDAESREPRPAPVVHINDCQGKEKRRAGGQRGSRRSRISPDRQPDQEDCRFSASHGCDAEWFGQRRGILRCRLARGVAKLGSSCHRVARIHWNREMLEQMRRADRQAWSTIEHLAGPLSWRNGNGQPARKTVERAN